MSILHALCRTQRPGARPLILMFLLVAGCNPASDSPDRARETGQTPASAPTWDELANTMYLGIYDAPVLLQNGVYEGEPFVPGGAARPRVVLVDDVRVTGDLNGDGYEDVGVLLRESSGGSGTFLYLAVVGHRDGTHINLGTALVGDRVQVRSIRYVDGRVEMGVIQQGPDDPLCCPTQKATRCWAVKTEGLVEISTEITGTLSTVDLEGVEWVLTLLRWEEPAPDSPRVTLTVQGERVAGSGGCNRYFATLTESIPGEIAVGEIGSTRMHCGDEAMVLESRYLARLRSAEQYGFVAGRLALTCRSGDTVVTMVFDARTPSP